MLSLAKTTSRAQDIFETSKQRANARYEMKVSECKKDFVDSIWNTVNDYIDDIGKMYPFHPRVLDDLRTQVNQQMKIVMYDKSCLQHEAIDELLENKIDWFSQPFFRGKDIKLSDVLQEFDMLKNDASLMPSEVVLSYINAGHRTDSAERWKIKRVASSTS